MYQEVIFVSLVFVSESIEGAYAKKIDVSFLPFEDESDNNLETNGLAEAYYNTNKGLVHEVLLDENVLKDIIAGSKTHITIYVDLSDNELYNALVVGHEALVHAAYSIKFGKKIADGISGNLLIKEFNKGYIKPNMAHGAHSLSKCTLMNKFVTNYRSGIKNDKDRVAFDKLVKEDKSYSGMADEGLEFQEKINKGEFNEKDF